tara:strand:- start:316 stop:564 length:249 start_codon:yes stop_codon:yes gene_type:complete
MDKIADLINSGGKAVYNLFSSMAVIIFVLTITTVAAPHPNWHGIAIMAVFMTSVLSFLAGRLILAITVFLILSFYCQHLLPG